MIEKLKAFRAEWQLFKKACPFTTGLICMLLAGLILVGGGLYFGPAVIMVIWLGFLVIMGLKMAFREVWGYLTKPSEEDKNGT